MRWTMPGRAATTSWIKTANTLEKVVEH